MLDGLGRSAATPPRPSQPHPTPPQTPSCRSGLEDARLNYIEQHAERLGLDAGRLEGARVAASQGGLAGETLDLCARQGVCWHATGSVSSGFLASAHASPDVHMSLHTPACITSLPPAAAPSASTCPLPRACRQIDVPTLTELAPKLGALVRRGVGLNTRAGAGRFITQARQLAGPGLGLRGPGRAWARAFRLHGRPEATCADWQPPLAALGPLLPPFRLSLGLV